MKARRLVKKDMTLAKYGTGSFGHARQLARVIALCRKGFSDAQIVARLSQTRGFRPPISPPRKVCELIAEARAMLKTSNVTAVSLKGRDGVRGVKSRRALRA